MDQYLTALEENIRIRLKYISEGWNWGSPASQLQSDFVSPKDRITRDDVVAALVRLVKNGKVEQRRTRVRIAGSTEWTYWYVETEETEGESNERDQSS